MDRGLGTAARGLGTTLAAGLAICGQIVMSLRRDAPAPSLLAGLALYALAAAVLFVGLRAGRRSPAPAPSPAMRELDRRLSGRLGWILLALILLGGLWLRLYRIDAIPPGINDDEAVNAIEATEIAAGKPFATFTERGYRRETMFHYLAAYSLRHPGLALAPLRAWPRVFGLTPASIEGQETEFNFIFPLRAVAIAGGTLTLLALFLFARAHFGPRPALLATLLMAVSPWHLLYSRVGLRVMLAPLFAIVTVALFLRALRTRSRVDHLAWGIAAGLGLWTYTTFRAVPLALLAFLLISRWRRRPAGAAGTGDAVGKAALAGFGAMAVLLLAVVALSGMSPLQFLFRGAYATSPPHPNVWANLLHAVTILNYFPERYAVISTRIFMGDGVSAVFGLVGLEPDTLVMASFASLGIVYVAWRAGTDPAESEVGREGRAALTLALLCLGASWLTIGWLGPSLSRMLANLPWLCLCGALFATRAWDDLAAFRPPLGARAAGLLMAGVAVLAAVQGTGNYFRLAARSEKAMQHFGAAQTRMGLFVRSLPPDQDVVVLFTRRDNTLNYLIGDRPHVQLLTDAAKVDLERFAAAPRATTFVLEYALSFTDLFRSLTTRFPQGEVQRFTDPRFDPDKPIFYAVTIRKGEG
jgi:hypothetical protein